MLATELYTLTEKKMLSTSEGLEFALSLQLSYAIGLSHPLAISVFHYGTSDRSEDELLEIIEKNFDLRLGPIIRFC